MGPIWNKIWSIVWYNNSDILEIVVTSALLGWGLWFVTHPSLFEGQVYGILAFIGSEWIWGLVFMLFGLLKILVLIMDSYRLRRIVAIMTAMLCMFITASLFQKNPSAGMSFAFFQIVAWSVLEAIRHGDRKAIRDEIRSIDPKLP